MTNQPLTGSDVRDMQAEPSRFDHMIHSPDDNSGRQAVLNDLLRMSQQIMERRISRSKSIAVGTSQASEIQQQLLQTESQIGARIFGILRTDQERSFFCLNETTWIWYEGWYDNITRQPIKQTIQYQISSDGVLKTDQTKDYNFIDGDELENFYNAVKVYSVVTEREMYQQPIVGA